MEPGWATVHSVTKSLSRQATFHCIYLSIVFFICLSVDEHLGCFLVLAILISVAVNVSVNLI